MKVRQKMLDEMSDKIKRQKSDYEIIQFGQRKVEKQK